MRRWLAFVILLPLSGILRGQGPDLSRIGDNNEKVKVLLAYCDSLRNSNPPKGTGPSANYPLILQAAQRGLGVTPSDDFISESRFAFFAGLGFYYQVKFDSAQTYFYRSLYAGDKAHSGKLVANACAALIPVDYQLQQSQRTDSCRNLLQAIADTTHDKAVLQDAYSALGSYYFQHSYYSTAQDFLLKSLALRKPAIDTSDNMKLKSDYALQCYLLAKVYQNADQNEKGAAMLEEGRPYSLASPLLQIRYLSSFVEVYSLLNHIDSSLYYEAQLEERVKNSPTVSSEAVSASLNLAQYYIKQRAYSSALPWVEKADSLADKSKSPILIYQARMIHGRYFEETGKFAQALPLLVAALPVAQKISTEHYTDILRFLALTQQGLGNTAGALDYYETYSSELDSLGKEKSSRNFADQQTRYETGQKELRIASLDKDNRLKALELQNGRNVRLLLIVGLVVVGIFALLLFFFYRKLAVVNDELTRANDTKARLFGIISHDLRSPVSRIVTLLQLQKEMPNVLDEPTRRKHEERLRAASENVLETMEDLLLWSKSQMQHFTPQPAPVAVHEVVEKEVLFLREPLEEKQVRTDNRVPAGFIRSTDENFLTVIIRNLMQNAVKYSPSGGTILIAADDGHLYITNPAAGAQAALLNAKLQNKQVDSKGSGLGLQIAADLAVSIGAKLFFRQEEGGDVTAVLAF